MKKLVTILLALAMILCLSIPAFATTDATLTIEGTGRTYNGYKLLHLTTSVKTEQHPAACQINQGGNHVDGCYNYAYSVNEKYEAILQTQAGQGRDILAYLSSLTGDNNTATLRPAADKIYRAIQEYNKTAAEDQKINPDKAGLTQTSEIEQGYWLFVDVTDLNGDADANSLVIVDTAGLAGVTIAPKTALPTVEKKVLDDEAATPNWQDSADYDIGDTVPFKLKGTLPANLTSYQTYTITFHDKLAEGMTLKADSFKVYADGTQLTTGYEVKTTDLADTDCTFEVVFPNVLAIEGVTKNTLFEIFYDATLDADAVVGAAGNPNEIFLEYSNDPYGTSTGKTEKDIVKVFTYKLEINKIDGVTLDALTGASFKLSKKNAQGGYDVIGEVASTEGNALSTFTWKGLDAGEYQLEETEAPEGYNKLDDVINFTINAKHDIQSADPQLTELTSTKGTANIATGTITETIKNNTGTVLPETGAMGTMWLIAGGTMLVMVAAVFMITRKKMSVFGD